MIDHPKLTGLAVAGLLFGAGVALAGQVEQRSAEALAEAQSNRAAAEASDARWRAIREKIDEVETSAGSRIASTSNANVFTVGSDANCDFPTLAAALGSAQVGADAVLHLRSDLQATETTLIRNRPGSLTIRGGFSNCSSTSPSGTRTTFNGQGSFRLFYLETSSTYSGQRMAVRLENLNLINGNAPASFGGGGLLVNGRQGLLEVSVRNVQITGNTAAFNGGGVSVRINGDTAGTGTPPALLDIGQNSVIAQNTATLDGGGLSCFAAGAALVDTVVRLDRVGVIANEARNGGGIAVDGCYNVLVYPGISLQGVTSNSAVGTGVHGNGGGVYLRGEESFLRLVGASLFPWGDPNNGGFVGLNSARRGAGVYLQQGAEALADDIHLVNNSATLEGGAVYSQDAGSLMRMRRFNAFEPCRPGSGVLALERCSVVSGNDGGEAGGAFAAQNGGVIEVQATRVVNNQANFGAIAATSGTEGGSLIRLENVVGWGNASAWLVATIHGIIELRWSTFADNQPVGSFLYVNPGSGRTARIRVYGSILRESGQTDQILGAGNGTIFYDCVIGWQSTNALAGNPVFYRVADPEFVSPGTRDYRPGPTSLAIDFCDDVQSPPSRDFDGLLRGRVHVGDPLPPGNPALGPYDVGAFEPRWLPDALFRDRFRQN
ncbi:MAG: hypothetical protein ACXIUM_13260 [Wenzhouxiangella sp.]